MRHSIKRWGPLLLLVAVIFVTRKNHVSVHTYGSTQVLVERHDKTNVSYREERYIFTSTGGPPWTESHSPNQSTDHDIRISLRLHGPTDVPPPTKFVYCYRCDSGNILQPPLSSTTVLKFKTTISTNLKILFLGDSITQQFASNFYGSVLGEEHEGGHVVLRSFKNGASDDPRVCLHVCRSVVAPVRGGGVCAYWRVLELMSAKNEAPYVNCKNEKGWSANESVALSNHRYSHPAGGPNALVRENSTRDNRSTVWYVTPIHGEELKPFSVAAFDCVVLRVPHGWMDLHEITRDRIVEEVELLHALFGARAVVISTLPFNNNVVTRSDWRHLIEINGMIRDVAKNWTKPPPNKEGVRWVLVQEFGNFTNQILWENARRLGYDNVSVPDFARQDAWEEAGAEFLLDRLQQAGSIPSKLSPSIPMVCSKPLSFKKIINVTDCPRNKISSDGMHWCMESLGARYAASIACLLGCVFNGEGSEALRSDENVKKCEQACNDQFMSLVPVEKTWIGNETTIFSMSSYQDQ